MDTLPLLARKIAHYYYSCGHELQVFVHRRAYYVRDQFGNHPCSPVSGSRTPHPNDGMEHEMPYEALGLYYRYEMAETGWSGDC